MDDRHLNTLSLIEDKKTFWLYESLIWAWVFYFIYNLISLPDKLPLPELDGTTTWLQNAMTPAKMLIASSFHVIQIWGWHRLLKRISEKWDWIIQSLRKWSIKMFIANFVIVVISQIIFVFVQTILTNDLLFTIETYLKIFSLLWETQDLLGWNYVFVEVPWRILKPGIPHMIITFMILIMYMQLNTITRKEHEKWQLQTQATEAELEALKNQIVPHFLFNILSSIRSLVKPKPQDARDMITDLSNLMRYMYSIGSSETPLLKDEIEIVKCYTRLQEIRYKGLKCEYKIAPETWKAKFPPMSIQPIVENAIKHGVEKNKEYDEILIQTTTQQTYLEVCIVNTGQINKNTTQNDGIGLTNTEKRLSHFFGKPVQLEPKKISQNRVCVKFQVPFMVQENGDKV